MIGQNGRKDDVSVLSKTDDTVVLVDSSCNLGQLRTFANQKKIIIVSFDYDSHKILSKNNIPHETSDNYLNEADLEPIQKNSYTLSKWHNNKPVIDELLNYEGVNLGQVFEVEFNYLLVPLLKKFVEISRIFEKYHDSEFIAAPDLYDIISAFSKSVGRLEKINDSIKDYLFDRVKFTFDIKGKSITINLSKSNYIKLKKISEKIFHVLFGPKKQFGNSRKSVLLVEFDITRYKKIFSNALARSLVLAVFNRRRPSIWNYESFSIIKRSKSAIITHYDVDDNNLENSIKNGISHSKKKLKSLWEQEQFFKSFFSINGLSFWEALKPVFMKLCERRIFEAIREIEITKRLFEKFSFSRILILSEIGFNEQIVVKLAKKFRIPILLIQHGLYFDTAEADDMNRFQGVFPIDADKFVVWGKLTEQHAIKSGVSSEKIEVIGSPLYDDVPQTWNENDQNFVLLATSGPVKEDVHDLRIKTIESYKETVKKICKAVSKLNKKLVIKLHPSPDEIDITELARKINPEITVVKARNILPLIQSCEVLVTIDVSTVILEAQILKKPVISISLKEYGWGNPSVLKSNSCISTEIDNFENILDRLLNDEDFKNSTIENGKRFAEEYLSNLGTASVKLLDFINKT